MHSAPLRWIAIFSFSALALAACGDDESGAGGSAATTSTTTTTTSAAGSGGAGGGGAGGADLLGTWKSKDCEPSGTMSSLRRTYVISPTGIAITFEQFAGAACEASPKLMTIGITGKSEILGPSQAVPGALDVIFNIESKAITPTAAGVDFLNGACGQYAWAADVEQDITEDGCGMLVPTAAACPAEYDISAVVDGALYFGDRSQSLCSEGARPTKLSEWGVVKQP